tara:strand:+ start:1885 stop:3621 length:1737 start_codon:yes stop_codon:yes gene_type:complete
MRIGIYCRVSTDKQKDNESLGLQEKIGVDYCIKNNYEYEIYRDVVSGAKIKRDGLNTLVDKIFKKDLDGIWLWNWDRLIREKRVMIYLEDLVMETKCKVFVDYRERDIINNEEDIMDMEFKSMISSQERRNIRRRFIAGRNAAWARGEGFQGQVGFGYKRVGKKVIPNDIEANIVRDIYNTFLRKDVKSKLDVYKRIYKKYKSLHDSKGKIKGIADSGRIDMILSDKKYLGTYTIIDQNGKEWDFDFGRIVDEDVFYKVQEKREYVKKLRKGRGVYNYILKGKVYCKDCGNSLWVRGGGTSIDKGGRGHGMYKYYMCATSSQKKYDNRVYNKERILDDCISKDKSHNNVSVSVLEEVVWYGLFQSLIKSKTIKEEYKKRYNSDKGFKEDLENKLNYYYKQLLDLDKRKKKMLNDYSKEIIDIDFYTDWLKGSYEEDKLTIEGKILKLKDDLINTKSTDVVDSYVDLMLDDLKRRKNITRKEHRRRLIEQYIGSVHVRRVGEKYEVELGIILGDSKEDVGLTEMYNSVHNNSNDLFLIKNLKYVLRSFDKKLNVKYLINFTQNCRNMKYEIVDFEVVIL